MISALSNVVSNRLQGDKIVVASTDFGPVSYFPEQNENHTIASVGNGGEFSRCVGTCAPTEARFLRWLCRHQPDAGEASGLHALGQGPPEG